MLVVPVRSLSLLKTSSNAYSLGIIDIDPVKYDLRKWNKRHDRMSKGISMTKDELKNLMRVLNKYFDENDAV